MSVPLQILGAYAVSATGMFLLALCIALNRNETVWAVLARFWRDYMTTLRRIGAAIVPASTPPRVPVQQTKQERALAALSARFASESGYELDDYERDVEKVLRRS